MSKTKKIAILAIIAMVLTMLPMSVFADTTSDRIYGDSRVQTALEICGAGWSSATTAILAPADQENLVDALAASALAGQENAPILLTYKGSLDPAVKAKIAALGVNKVYIVGAISDAVAAEVDAMTNVSIEVLKGSNRWATAAAINAKLTNPAGSFVVGYDAVADALSVASFAAKNKYAIILAGVDGMLPSGQATVGSVVYTVGGPTLVADIAGATRIAGTDRFDTNKKVVETLGFSYGKIYVANGLTGLVDALAVAPLAAKAGAFVALTNGSGVAAASVLGQKMSETSVVIALGGPAVVSDSAKGQVKYGASAFAIDSAKVINGKQLEIKFNKAADKNSVIDTVADPDVLLPTAELTRLPLHGADKDVDAAAMYASLSTDGMTLTLRADGDEFFDGTYALYIASGITSKTYGEALGAYRTQFVVEDKTAPEVVSIVYNAATDQIEVLMSEPVATGPSVVLDNGSPLDFVNTNTMETKYIYENKWTKGETISVQASGAIDYKDNEQVGVFKKDVKIEMDETNLGVTSVTQSSSNQFKVVFNKAIAPTDSDAARVTAVQDAVKVFRSGVQIDPDEVIVSLDTDDASKRTYKVSMFTDDLDADGVYDAGAAYTDLYNGKSSVTLTVVFGEDELSDVFGNTNPEVTKTVAMTKDTTGPQMISVRLSGDDDEFLIARFDEDVNEDTLANLKVRKGGIDVTDLFTIVVGDPATKEISFEYDAGTIPNGVYTLRVDKDAVADDHGNKNVAQSKEFTISGGDSSVIADSVLDADSDDNLYVINFGTDADADGDVDAVAAVGASALELSSYTLNGSALPAGTDIYFSETDKSQVTIELPASSVNYNNSAAVLRVAKVKDANGLSVDPVNYDNASVVDNIKPTLKTATLAGNVLTLTFDENMFASGDTVDDLINDFEIKGGSTALEAGAGDGVINVSVDGKKVYITVTDATDTNWNTIKAYSKITIKTLDGSDFFGDDVGDPATLQNSIKKDVIVTVTKL